jgi:hypothetical protein
VEEEEEEEEGLPVCAESPMQGPAGLSRKKMAFSDRSAV